LLQGDQQIRRIGGLGAKAGDLFSKLRKLFFKALGLEVYDFSIQANPSLALCCYKF